MGASKQERQAWHLGQAQDYAYLRQSTCFQLQGVDDAAEFQVSEVQWV